MSQWRILRSARFWPIFWTQFFGAFNDNVFKNALTILVAYELLTVPGVPPTTLVPLCAGVFILPFFLFSASAGQLADKLSKALVIRWVKLLEIAIMVLAALGFFAANLPILLGVLFLMGLQSTLFGPAKYSILPELLGDDDLVGGNALVETGTFVAILIGTTVGGALVAAGQAGQTVLSAVLITVAIVGFMTSRSIVETPAGSPNIKFSWNPVRPALETFNTTRRNRPVFLSILGISWFWFLGASFLTLLPTYTRDVLRGDEMVVTLLLGLFCVGISIGSLLCERLSDGRLELGLVPLGSIGMTLFAVDIFFIGVPNSYGQGSTELMGPGAFLGMSHGWRIIADFVLLAIAGGFYTVPLYTMIQQRTEAAVRSRVIAGNNILNALFMVISSVLLVVLGTTGVSIPQIFLVLAVLNAAAALYIYTVIPEFLLRFVVWLIAKVLYRLRVDGSENLPTAGPAVLVCNHQSFVDWLIIASAVRTPVRFVMHHTYMYMPVVGFLFRDAKVIPIAPARDSEATLQAAFDKIAEELEAGEIVCIFPEGKLTPDGHINPFRSGIEQIIERSPVQVVPMALNGLWGSVFSRFGRGTVRQSRRPLRAKVTLTVGAAIAPDEVSARGLQARVCEIGGWEPPQPQGS